MKFSIKNGKAEIHNYGLWLSEEKHPITRRQRKAMGKRFQRRVIDKNFIAEALANMLAA